MLLIYSNFTTVQVSDRIYKGALVNRMCYCNTPFFNPQNNTHRDVYKYTPFHVLPEHTLVSFLNTPVCVPTTHLKLCFTLVLNLTHLKKFSAERYLLSHL